MTPLLEIQNLSHVYSEGTPFEHAAIRDLSLSVERGEFIGLIGHTGSGKSTLIQHLNGLLKPTSGKILYNGEDIWKDVKFTRQIRYHVGLVFQYPEYQLFEETVFRDIAFGPKNMGLSEAEIRARVLRAAGFVGIPEAELEKSPFDLSGGQKRRVAIAGVIAMEPEVLILDEPTAGLDPAGRESILQNIRDYQKAQNATVIMVSHSMEEIASNVTRLVVMNDGRIARTGTPREVFTHAQELMEIGLDVPQVTRVFLRLRELGLDVDTSVFTVEQAKEAFLRMKRRAAAMLKDVTLGQYFPGTTAVHRLDPRTKLVLVIVYIVALFLAKNVVSYALVFVFLAAVVMISRIQLKVLLRSMKPLLFIIILTGLLNLFYGSGEPIAKFWIFKITKSGIQNAVFMVLRITMLLAGTFMLTYTTSPIALTDGLESLLSPLKKLHAPVHELSMMMCIALRFIPTLLEETDKIMSAQKARGADFESGNLLARAKAMIPILVPLFISAFRRADELATAMECRCYHGGEGRTRLKQLRYMRLDAAAYALGTALLAAVIVLRCFGL